jgi:hypothetical protein
MQEIIIKTYSVYGRKIPLKQILEEMTEEQIGMDSIDNIGMTEVSILFSQICAFRTWYFRASSVQLTGVPLDINFMSCRNLVLSN